MKHCSESYVLKLADIIDRSRRATGHPRLGPEELLETATAWAEIVAGLPEESLDRAYLEAMRGRTTRGPFQAQDLRGALPEPAKLTFAPSGREELGTVSCLFCDGVGYQFTVQKRYGIDYTSVRPCVCLAAPPSQRNAYALSEPDYHRDARGYWRHVPSMFAHPD